MGAARIAYALYWDLTLMLGAEVADFYHSQKPNANLQFKHQQQLATLNRIGWFSEGHIPDTARMQLISDKDILPDPLCDRILQAIINLLQHNLNQNPEDQNSFAYRNFLMNLVISKLLLKKSGENRAQLEQKLNELIAENEIQDYVALEYLEKQRQSPLALVLPRQMHKYFFNKGLSRLGLKKAARWAMYAATLLLPFLFVFPFAGIPQLLNIEIRTHGPAGENQLVELTNKNVYLTNETDTLKTQINEYGQAFFRNIKATQNDTLTVWLPDTSYQTIPEKVFYVVEKENDKLWPALHTITRNPKPNAIQLWEHTGIGNTPITDYLALYIPEAQKITGKVMAADSSFVPNATIKLDSLKTQTNDSGYFELAIPPAMQKPQQKLLAMAEGYYTTEQNIAYTQNNKATIVLNSLNLNKDSIDYHNYMQQALLQTNRGQVGWPNALELFNKALALNYNNDSTQTLINKLNDRVKQRMAQYRTKLQQLLGNKQWQTVVDTANVALALSDDQQIQNWKTQALKELGKPDEIQQAEENLWQAAEKTNTCEAYRKYLTDYPTGKFAEQAKAKKEELCKIPFTSYTETATRVPFDMVAIKGGTFKIGSGENAGVETSPPYNITLNDFYMGKTEVTIGQYLAFCKEENKHWPEWLEKGNSYYIYGNGSNKDYYKSKGMSEENINHPITGVSWNDAKAYAEWLSQKTGKNYRLPSEAEWEYAAGGGAMNRTKWAGTNNVNNLGEYAVYSSNSGSKTAEVKSKKPNALGLHDMSGNVWEWCEDDWHNNYNGIPKDGSAWVDKPRGSGRVSRGGSWNDYASGCRVADRIINRPASSDDGLGFRLVLVR